MCLIILRWGAERTYRVTRRSLFVIEDWIQQILDIVSFIRIRRWRVNVIFVSYLFLRLDRTWCTDPVACRRSAIYPSVTEKLYVHGIHDIQESETSHHSFKDFSTSYNCNSFPLSLGRLKIARAEILQDTCREPHPGVGVWAIDDRLREARHE